MLLFTAQGTLADGTGYEVVFTTSGGLEGDGLIAAEILSRAPDPVGLSPTGPHVPLSLTDPAAVAAALRYLSAQVRFTGAVPPLAPSCPPGSADGPSDPAAPASGPLQAPGGPA